MRQAMRKRIGESIHKEDAHDYMRQRATYADKLVEKWSRAKGFYFEGQEKLSEMSDTHKARNVALFLENQAKQLKKDGLNENVVSTAYGNLTPEQVMRVVQIGYRGAARQDIFWEWAMSSAYDSIVFLSPVYNETVRGATEGDIMHESSAYRAGTEMEEDTAGTGDGSTVEFSGTTSNPPVRPYFVKVIVDNIIVGQDDGSGSFIGSGIDSTGTNTINYTSGEYTFTLSTAPTTGQSLILQYDYNSELVAQYNDVAKVNLELRRVPFRFRRYPMIAQWSDMTQILLDTSYGVNGEGTLVNAAADELRKSLDYYAVKFAYRKSKANGIVNFDTDWSSLGASSQTAHAQDVVSLFDQATNRIYRQINRGGVTKVFGGPDACGYLTKHKEFVRATNEDTQGVHKFGTLNGIDIFKCPESLVPNDELVGHYKSNKNEADVGIGIGTLIPLVQTPINTFKNFNRETGLASYGEIKSLVDKFLVRMKLDNLADNFTSTQP